MNCWQYVDSIWQEFILKFSITHVIFPCHKFLNSVIWNREEDLSTGCISNPHVSWQTTHILFRFPIQNYPCIISIKPLQQECKKHKTGEKIKIVAATRPLFTQLSLNTKETDYTEIIQQSGSNSCNSHTMKEWGSMYSWVHKVNGLKKAKHNSQHRPTCHAIKYSSTTGFRGASAATTIRACLPDTRPHPGKTYT
jgi:hypothetical protein